jgi:hypothetical protein
MLPRMIAPRRPPSNVVRPRNWHFQCLAERLRPDEIAHWLAMTGADSFDADVAARGYMQTPGLVFVVVDAIGRPQAAGGFHEERRGAWQGWMVGTPEGWSTHWRSITKATRWLMGELFTMGARRLAVDTIASRTAATDWYAKALGMRYEGTQRRAGAQGEDIVTYSRIAEDTQP